MSALDKAFIKVYHQETGPASAGVVERPAETAAVGDVKRGPTRAAAPAADSCGAETPCRVHGAHAEVPAPHRAFNDQPATDSPPVAAPPSQQLQKPPLQKPPSPPSLPALAELPVEQEDAQDFTPDWEVDRLVWPAICERLLESESHYFRSVGQRLKEATRDSHHVVMITGARRGEGRTTLALCLARCAAKAGVEVAVVDADLENPQLGGQLGMETSCSWLEVVAGKSPLNEAAVSSLEDGLTLFPLMGFEDTVAQACDSRHVAVLQAIAASFPLVIVDCGPLGADGRHPFSTDGDSPIDTAIVVRDVRNTTENRILATASLLQRGGVHAVGIAENFRDSAAPE